MNVLDIINIKNNELMKDEMNHMIICLKQISNHKIICIMQQNKKQINLYSQIFHDLTTDHDGGGLVLAIGSPQ